MGSNVSLLGGYPYYRTWYRSTSSPVWLPMAMSITNSFPYTSGGVGAFSAATVYSHVIGWSADTISTAGGLLNRDSDGLIRSFGGVDLLTGKKGSYSPGLSLCGSNGTFFKFMLSWFSEASQFLPDGPMDEGRSARIWSFLRSDGLPRDKGGATSLLSLCVGCNFKSRGDRLLP